MSDSNTLLALFSELLGSLAGLLKNLFLLSVAVIIEAAILVFHYLSWQSSLYLIGSEQKPLSEDPLFGQWLGDYFGDANLISSGAFVMVSVIGLGCFWLAEQVMEWRRYGEQRAAFRQHIVYARTGDTETNTNAQRSIDSVNHKMRQTKENIFVISILLGGVVASDFYITIYRGLAGVHGFSEGDPEAPNLAIHTIRILTQELEQNGFLFAWSAVVFIAVALLCCSFLAPFAIEYYGSRLASQGQRLVSTIFLLLGSLWQAIAGGDGGSQLVAPEVTINEPPAMAATESESSADPAIQEETQPGNQQATATESPKKIIGAGVNAQVSISEARRNPDRYWIDPDTLEIWDSAYRQRLMGNAVT